IAQTALASTASGFAALVVTLPAPNDAGPGADQTLYLAPLDHTHAKDAPATHLNRIARDGPLARLYLGKPARIGDLTAGAALGSESGSGPRPDAYRLGALDGARSVIAVPVLDRDGRTHGGIALGHHSAHFFSDDDVALLTSLGHLATMTIENEQLLRVAQERAQELDIIFEHVGDAISLLDARGNTKRENRAARQLRQAMMFGAWPDEDDDEANDDPAAVRTRDIVRATPVALMDRQGAAREYEARHVTLVAPSPRPLSGGERTEARTVITGAVVVHHDVTETRRLIEERQAREEADTRRTLLQSVVDQVPAGVFLVRGPDARMVLANAVVQRMFGADWPVGMPLATFFEQSGMRVQRHDGSMVNYSDLATLRTLVEGEPARHVQMLLRQAGGATLSVLLNAVPLDGATLGEPAGTLDPTERAAIVVLQDVSALKEVERLKDDFIAIAAHELKSPVAEIKGNVDTLLLQTARGNGQALDVWQREAMEAVVRGSSRLAQLTNDLLDVSRIQAGLLELRQEPHDLVALTRRVVKSLQANTRDHTIVFQPPEGYLVAAIDARRIEQMLANLIGNAIKYSPDADHVEVRLCACGADEALLDVADHGIGIPQEQQSVLFGRFARANNARERRIEGNGLGLYLSREVVRGHNGRIWFDSAPGQGTTFHVTLPLWREG
ncbi:MAG TPA: ATP-binding protein, partial [Ktedonobacterales bacterium]|nr:ATP-binding protein [Ktedonobacterales bacterium]